MYMYICDLSTYYAHNESVASFGFKHHQSGSLLKHRLTNHVIHPLRLRVENLESDKSERGENSTLQYRHFLICIAGERLLSLQSCLNVNQDEVEKEHACLANSEVLQSSVHAKTSPYPDT